MDTRFDELLEFPCFQTFKVMGVADERLPDAGCGLFAGAFTRRLQSNSQTQVPRAITTLFL